MTITIGRREFLSALGGAAAAWPLTARAQQPAMPVIGFLHARSADDLPHLVAAFRRGLSDTGFIEGQNVTIEYRWAQGQYDRLPALAAELVGRQVAVIVAAGGEPAALAAKAATSTIPIVFNSGSDPVKLGLVASINRPGGNVTGVSILLRATEAKRFGLIRELLPQATAIAVLVNPNRPDGAEQLSDLQDAARTLGKQIHVLNASTDGEIEAAFAVLSRQPTDALVVANDTFFIGRRDEIVALAARQALPAIYNAREFAAAGGLIAYGPSLPNAYREMGVYSGKILKGEKPANLPVQQSTIFELVINLKTAKALGLTLPAGLLAIADEVIE